MVQYFRHATALLGLSLCLLLGARPLLAQLDAERGLDYLHNYDSKTYGASVQNWTVLQDLRGLIYAGNNDGILEYDGTAWRLIPTANGTVVRSLAMDRDGVLFVGGQREMGYLAPDSLGLLQFVTLLDRVPEEDRVFQDIWQTLALPDGVYFSTNARLLRWDGQTIRSWTPETAFHVSFAVRDTLYVRSFRQGLLRMEGDVLRPVPGGERFADERIYVMLPFDERRILIGSRTEGLFLFDGRTFTRFTTEADAFLQQHQLYHGARLADGTYALATLEGGIAVIDAQGRLRWILNKATGLRDEAVKFAYPDRQGGLWLALNDGLARVETPAPLTHFHEDLGLRGIVQAIRRHAGRLYVATTLGVYRLEPAATDGALPGFSPVEGIIGETFALHTAGNTLLAATRNGVYVVTGTRAAPLTDRLSFSLHPSKQDPDLLFVGLLDGLGRLRYDRALRQWQATADVAGIAGGEVRHASEGPDGMLWLSLNPSGVLRVTFPDSSDADPDVRRFDLRHGLPDGYTPTFEVNGRVVFGSSDGLFRPVPGDTLFVPETAFGTRFNEAGRAVSRLVEEENRVWIHGGTSTDLAVRQPDGTYTLQPTALPRLSEATLYALFPETTALGAVLWLGGEDGLTRYEQRVARAYDAPFTTLLRRIRAGSSVVFNGAERSTPQQRTLAYADNALRFEYAATSYDAPARMAYRYLLDGFDKTWSPWSNESRKDYTNLPEGDYTFRAEALNRYGIAGKAAAFRFTIRPPWWRTWWAYTFYALLAGGVLLVMDRVQRRRLLLKERERAKMLEAQLRAEAAEMETRALKAENEAKELELEKARELEQAYFAIQQQATEIRHKNEENEQLLLNILPESIADRLKRGEKTIADNFPDVTVLFSDIVGFTQLSSHISAEELVGMLNGIFSAFDQLSTNLGVEKIKTIGDAYMAVAGLPEYRKDHAEVMVSMAVGMLETLEHFNTANKTTLNIRIGINTGPVVAGVIGRHKFIYDLWGDTVNTASRMESHGLPGRIHMTQATYRRANGVYRFEPRGVIEVKGKGQMETYLLA